MEITTVNITPDGLLLGVPIPEARKFASKFKAGEYDIVRHEDKRSTTANSYCWVLCDKISKKLRVTKEDVYRDAIHDVGAFRDFHGLDPDEAKTLMEAWRRLGVGWIAEQVDYEPDGEHVVMRGYYGSSVYSVKRMARLIDWLVQEATGLEIEVKPEEYIQSLLESWEATKRG